MKRFSTIVVVAAATFGASSAQAWTRADYLFPGSAFPLHYSVGTGDRPSGIGSTVLPEITQQVMSVWKAPSCTSARSTYDGTTSLGFNLDDGTNVVSFDATWPAELGPTVLGVTQAQLTSVDGSTWFRSGADVSINAQDPTWSTDGTPSSREQDLFSTVLHEVGHWWGLGHSSTTGTAMYPSITSGSTMRTLSADDIAGICGIYASGGAIPDPVDPCLAAATTCGDCTHISSTNCGWCGATNQCMVTNTGTGPALGTCASGWSWNPSECPGAAEEACSQYTADGCGTCTMYEGCGFCRSSGRCELGTEDSSTTSSCSGANWVWYSAVCDWRPASAAFGEDCNAALECIEAVPCLVRSGSGEDDPGFCSRYCTSDCDCPSNYACFALSGGDGRKVCAPGTNQCPASRPDAGSNGSGPEAGVQQEGDASTSGGEMDSGSSGGNIDASGGGGEGGGGRGRGCAVDTQSNGSNASALLCAAAAAWLITRRRRRS